MRMDDNRVTPSMKEAYFRKGEKEKFERAMVISFIYLFIFSTYDHEI